jgi:flagellar assembly protein FliH
MSGVIPKEKLAGYQRWQIGSFDKPAAAPPRVVSEPTPPVASSQPAEPEEAVETVTTIPFPTADDLARINEEARNEGYQRGYEEGRTAGEAELQAKTDEQLAHLTGLVSNLQASLAELDQHVADQLLDLSLEVAAQILRSSLKVNRELLLPIIREAINELPLHHGNISLYLNPADTTALSSLIKEQLTHTGAQIIADSNIAEGGCVIKAGSSEIDASMGVRWRRVLEAIGIKVKEWLPNP